MPAESDSEVPGLSGEGVFGEAFCKFNNTFRGHGRVEMEQEGTSGWLKEDQCTV